MLDLQSLEANSGTYLVINSTQTTQVKPYKRGTKVPIEERRKIQQEVEKQKSGTKMAEKKRGKEEKKEHGVRMERKLISIKKE